jgi:toxin-antitoxin system PIN domain toxin
VKLFDVNVLVYAHRVDAVPDHPLYADWLRVLASSPAKFGVSEAVLAGFVRVVTNPRIFREPTSVEVALDFCKHLHTRSNAVILKPGQRNWEIFDSLCRQTKATGKLTADAWHAALAIEYGCQWNSTDSDFARFPGLDWKHPLS